MLITEKENLSNIIIGIQSLLGSQILLILISYQNQSSFYKLDTFYKIIILFRKINNCPRRGGV